MARYWNNLALNAEVWRRIGIDKLELCGIILFTNTRAESPDVKNTASRQTTGLAPASLSQSTSGTRSRRTVSDQRVLRRRRLGSGQVRDAPACSKRRACGEQGRRHLRLLPALLLSSSVGFPAG